MKKLVSSTLLFIMLSSNIVHAISNDITLSNTTLNEKIEIIDNNEIIYMSTNQVIDVTNNTEVLDENGDPIRLLGDGVTDETDKIEKLIEYAISKGRELYFPEGIYKITRDIDLSKVRLPNSSSCKISGDKDGLSIFDGTFNTEKMLRLIHSGYSGEIDCVQIENIVFNNMGIEITQRMKKEVIIKNNIFMNGNYTREKNSDGSISKATMEPYIVAKNTKYTVENNIFLRGTNYPGRGIATYRSENTNISNNFFGDLDSIDDAARMLPTEVISRLAIIKNSNLVEGHQGNFFTAINNERYDTNVLISNNYFDMVKTRNILSDFPNDVPVHGINVEKEEQRRDHIIYSKCYENLNIVGNYFKGMENGAAGGVKIRNGKNAYVGSNYFDDVPLLTYIYGDLSRNDTLLYDTVIHNNLFHAKTNFGGEGTGILYYQSFIDGETLEFDVKNSDGTVTKDVWKDAYGDVKNFIIYKNSFLSDERDRITISGRANTAYGNNEFLAYGNTYMELSTLVNYNNKGNYELPEASEGLILSKVNAGYNTYKDIKIPLTPAKVDQSYLEEALGEADKFYQDIINNNLVGDLEGQYSEEATNEFKDKLYQTNNLINSGNLTQAEANKNLTEITEALDKLKDSVKPMGEAPVLLKVTDLQIKKGDTVDFMQGIYIIDNKDTKEQLDIKIDLGDFNNLNPGTYTIKYTVTDSDGNVITFTRSIEVLREDEVIPPEEEEVIPPQEDTVVPPEEDYTTNDNESSEDITNGTTSNGNESSGNTSSNNVSSGIISNITTLNGNESKGNTSSSIASNSTIPNVDTSKNDISNNNNSDKESLNDNSISETKDENGVSRVFTSRRKMSFSWLFLLPLLLILVLLLLLKRKKEDDDSDNN
ncbi:immunoglobulin-like domain-containing protein [uncultured Clostridium sp.]|uniref:immunoglobulin-like domain-containing protein n=1 Tax=uncultured Clostridium sp. TaxID=59620 RepID=UPI0025CBB437|nr:immunoglobulin-like domain-containing protein [uncultured Clostridium sp.]